MIKFCYLTTNLIKKNLSILNQKRVSESFTITNCSSSQGVRFSLGRFPWPITDVSLRVVLSPIWVSFSKLLLLEKVIENMIKKSKWFYLMKQHFSPLHDGLGPLKGRRCTGSTIFLSINCWKDVIIKPYRSRRCVNANL